jgi:hypothetical protein
MAGYISSEMISETTNMSIEEAAEIGALLLNGGAGRISDDGGPKRPWLFIATSTREDAEDLYEAFGCRGLVKEEKNGRGWRFGAWGNHALVMLTYLLRGGLKGARGGCAPLVGQVRQRRRTVGLGDRKAPRQSVTPFGPAPTP